MIATKRSVVVAPDASKDSRIDPQIRRFLAELNKDPSRFWEKPGAEVRATLTDLQAKTPVDMSGVTVAERTIIQDGRKVPLYIMKPDNVQRTPPVIVFAHGGVWIAGNFDNHKRLVRDLVVGTGAVAVFPEYTPIPDAVYPTQVEQVYATAKWLAAHGAEINLDGSRIALAGNSVGGTMATAVAMMAKDRRGPKIRFQLLLIPATDTNFETQSYRRFGVGRFLARDFMVFGWNIYAPDDRTRAQPYAVPMRATVEQLRGLPPALIVTAENDPLRDEGEAYGRKLREAGVDVATIRYDGTIHDFVVLNGVRNVPSTQTVLRQANAELKKRLKG